MNYKKDFRKLKNVTTMGAATLQASSLLTTHRCNPAGSIPGMIGVGVAGGVADVSFRLASGDAFRRKRR
jgi:hypothetical protein